MKKPFLSVIIPAYNEENRITLTLLDIRDYLYAQPYTFEVIVVNDGSKDRTVDVVNGIASNFKELKLINNEINSGKGYAVNCGMKAAQGEFLLFMDADNSVKINEVEKFLEEAKKGAEVVIGSIHHEEASATDNTEWYRRHLRKISKKMIRHALTPGVYDTQRGFKLFTSYAAKLIFSKQTVRRFGFDIELLVIAKANKLKVIELPVSWNNPAGSTIKFSTYFDVFDDFFKIFLLKIVGTYFSIEHTVLHFFDSKEQKKKGKGFVYKNKEFVHHTDLHHTETALYNLMHSQKLFLFLIVSIFIAALIINWHLTLIITISGLTLLYFIDLIFNTFLIFRSFKNNPEIKITGNELEIINDSELPNYTIFCPLYKEWQVVPQFVTAMKQLDYPVEKLQIMFLLEENDKETIEKISAYNLPSHFVIVVVPHSNPKTKPKAMNYGLEHVTGEYLVIYDAEDVPESDQLKKAVLAFQKARKNIVCIQAKLNFYNPHQNTLTRIFTAEYSLWFDLILPGLQSINAPIPLGGTSNHFKVSALRELNGWDAFNVTEDADLGMRLAKRGYRTAILESTTYEEANSGLINWYNQRSRWIKGYIQTYFVHTRNQKSFLDQRKLKDILIFHFNVGGKILSMFVNPFMWLLTLTYFLFKIEIGPFIETFFPGPILLIGVISLIFGNFIYLYCYMIGCAKRGYYSLIKFVFLVPFYWLGMSIAAWKAMYEIFVKPHYWSKTVHGLHLKKEQIKTV